MADQQALIPQEQATPTPTGPAMIDVIREAAANPAVDVEKMRALLDMKRDIDQEQQKLEFMAALAKVQANVPRIGKDGLIEIRSKSGAFVANVPYATLENIDEAIRPLLAEEGFALSFNEESITNNLRTYSARLSHRGGYAETKTMTFAIDTSGAKNPTQAAGSTASYARRHLIKLHLNLIEVGEDDDSETLTDQQIMDLDALIVEVNADKPRFLSLMGVDSLASILQSNYAQAVRFLEGKRRG